uniref:Uncharacterized protein n=1 Tax=Anguilla anguilla TaxID=7936 RepID=A0A0E9WR38_ANGAN
MCLKSDLKFKIQQLKPFPIVLMHIIYISYSILYNLSIHIKSYFTSRSLLNQEISISFVVYLFH